MWRVCLLGGYRPKDGRLLATAISGSSRSRLGFMRVRERSRNNADKAGFSVFVGVWFFCYRKPLGNGIDTGAQGSLIPW